MDDVDANVLISLQLQNLDRLLKTRPNIKDQTNVSDGCVALVTYCKKLAIRLAFIHDRQMGRNIVQAVHQDRPTL